MDTQTQGTMPFRHAARGANTPWYSTRLIRGRGVKGREAFQQLHRLKNQMGGPVCPPPPQFQHGFAIGRQLQPILPDRRTQGMAA